MINLKNTILLAFSILLLQSCEKEKIGVQEIKGYFFASNPKYSARENTLNSMLESINKTQENSAVKNGDTTYVGFSNDPEKRLIEHNNVKTKSTKGYRPWKIFYYEKCESRIEARKRERHLKSGTGKEQIK